MFGEMCAREQGEDNEGGEIVIVQTKMFKGIFDFAFGFVASQCVS